MVKLESSTGSTRVSINGDKTAIVFQSIDKGYQVYWPTKDWESLKRFIEDANNAEDKPQTSNKMPFFPSEAKQ